MEGFFYFNEQLGLVLERCILRIPPEALPRTAMERLCWVIILNVLWRKNRINIPPHLFKPILSLSFRACDNNAECSAVEIGDSAKTENAILPDCLEGISKNVLFPFRRRIGRVEYDGSLGF